MATNATQPGAALSGRYTRTNFFLNPGSRRVLGDGKVISRLQVHPHLSGCAEITGQS
jgi:hypothetical protein